jgi:hypothetical protein
LNPMCDTVLVARIKYITKAIPLSEIPEKITKRLGNLAELTTLREDPIKLKQKRTVLQAKAIREELLKSKSQLIMLNTLNIDGLMGNKKIATVHELRQNHRSRAGPGKPKEANNVTAAAAEGDPSFVLHQYYGLETGGKEGTADKQSVVTPAEHSQDQTRQPLGKYSGGGKSRPQFDCTRYCTVCVDPPSKCTFKTNAKGTHVGLRSNTMCSCPAHQEEAIFSNRDRSISKEHPNGPTTSQRKRLRKKAAKELKTKNNISQPQGHLLNIEPLIHSETANEAAQSIPEVHTSTEPQSEGDGKSGPGAQRRSWQMQVTSDLGGTVPQYRWKAWKATTQPTIAPKERQEEARSHSSGLGSELYPPASGRTEEADGYLAHEWKAPDQDLTESKQRRLRRLRRATWNDYAPQTQLETSEERSTTLDMATQSPEITRKEAYAQTNESGVNGTELHPNRGRDQGSPISPLLWLAQNAPPFQPEVQLSPNQRDIEGWLRVQDMLDGRPPLGRSLPVQSSAQHGPVLVLPDPQDASSYGTAALGLYFPNWQQRHDDVLDQWGVP